MVMCFCQVLAPMMMCNMYLFLLTIQMNGIHYPSSSTGVRTFSHFLEAIVDVVMLMCVMCPVRSPIAV